MKLRITRAVIAHRINTVVQCDQVMVMSAGTVEEIGTPGSLLSRHTGYHSTCFLLEVSHLETTSSFLSLVLDTGAASSRKLISIASAAEVVVEEQDTIAADFDNLKADV